MFSKLKKILTKEKTEPLANSGSVEFIIVAQEALEDIEKEPYGLVQSVIDFTNTMFQSGHYRPDELPAEALQAYYCDYYLTQVNNGGHSQFVHNSRLAPETMNAIAKGLDQMGATETHQIFLNMLEWAEKNPAEAAAQTGFNGGRAAYLDELDTQFYDVERSTPMINASAKWVANLANLRAVPKADIQKIFAETAQMNPNIVSRTMAARVHQIRHMLSDPLYLGFGYAANLAPTPAPVHALGGGAEFDVAGEKRMAFGVNAVGQKFFGISDETGAHLYERIEPENPTIDRNDPDDMSAALADGRMAAFKSPEVGAHLVTMSPEDLQMAAKTCEQVNAPVALDLLLRTAETDPGLTFVAVREVETEEQEKGPLVLFSVVGQSEVFFAVVSLGVSVLLKSDLSTALSNVSRQDIDDHAKRVAA